MSMIRTKQERGSCSPKVSRYNAYQRTLETDKNAIIFDDKIRDLLMKYMVKPERAIDIVKKLDSISYSQSHFISSQIEEQICNFEGDRGATPNGNPHFEDALNLLRESFPAVNHQIQVNNTEELRALLSVEDTHPGLPWLCGYQDKKEYLDELNFDNLMEKWERVKRQQRFVDPIMIGTRSQSSIPFEDGKFTGVFKRKSRMVSMIHTDQILAEATFVRVLQPFFHRAQWTAAGKNMNQIQGLILGHKFGMGYWTSLDYSKFDQNIAGDTIRAIFGVIEDSFISYDKKLLRALRESLVHKSFLAPNGRLRYSSSGLPSGSMFTSLVGSMVNFVMTVTLMNSIGWKYQKDYKFIVMGDDLIVFSKKPMDLESAAHYLSHNFGAEVHPDKSAFDSLAGSPPKFLSVEWRSNGAYRPIEEFVTKILYPERYRPYHNGQADPVLVLYSYFLAYPSTAYDNFHVERFRRDHDISLDSRETAKYLSGYIGYYLRYSTKPSSVKIVK